MKSSNLYQVPFLWFWRLGCLAPIQVPKKKLKSKQNQKSYQHFHHFTIPGKLIGILLERFSSSKGMVGVNSPATKFPRDLIRYGYGTLAEISGNLKKSQEISWKFVLSCCSVQRRLMNRGSVEKVNRCNYIYYIIFYIHHINKILIYL